MFTQLFLTHFHIYIMYSSMPSNLNFSFNFGVILLATLIFLLITGFLSVLFYSNNLELSFTTLILGGYNNFNYFFLRVMHNTFANMFFIFIYLHIVKSWFYTSNNNIIVLLIGIIIYFISCAIAFFGYCLPMGQMWYWAAIVIFSLLSILPYGNLIILYLFGSFSISSRTLSILFFLHFISPLILTLLVGFHLLKLHWSLSSTTSDFLDLVYFYPYYLIIDLFIVSVYAFLCILVVFFFWFYFFESANFLAFNWLVTPLHIYPDWFLLFPYACLRWIDSKLIGVFLLIFIILNQFSLPIIASYFKLFHFSILNIFMVCMFILLTFFGWYPSVYPFDYYVVVFQFLTYLLAFIFLFLYWFKYILFLLY